METDDLAAFYGRACPPLVGLLTVIGGSRSDAEEVAQDAFVRLIEHWPKVSRYDDPEAWLRTVAVRLLISRGRRRQVAARGLQVLGLRTPLATAPDDGTVDLERALRSLPIAQRAVIVLHHVHDLPVDRIAELLHVPAGTVKSRLARARAALAPALADPERSGR